MKVRLFIFLALFFSSFSVFAGYPLCSGTVTTYCYTPAACPYGFVPVGTTLYDGVSVTTYSCAPPACPIGQQRYAVGTDSICLSTTCPDKTQTRGSDGVCVSPPACKDFPFDNPSNCVVQPRQSCDLVSSGGFGLFLCITQAVPDCSGIPTAVLNTVKNTCETCQGGQIRDSSGSCVTSPSVPPLLPTATTATTGTGTTGTGPTGTTGTGTTGTGTTGTGTTGTGTTGTGTTSTGTTGTGTTGGSTTNTNTTTNTTNTTNNNSDPVADSALTAIQAGLEKGSDSTVKTASSYSPKYAKTGNTMSGVFSSFSSTVSSSPLISSAQGFFTVSPNTSSCPTWQADAMGISLVIDHFCKPLVTDTIFPLMRVVLTLVFSFYAFRVAFL